MYGAKQPVPGAHHLGWAGRRLASFQPLLALDERQLSNALAVQVQKIEGEEHEFDQSGLSTGGKTALAATLAERDTIEPLKTLQQSANAKGVPFAALCCRYSSLVQLPRDGLDGDKARFPKFTNCRSQGLGSRIRGLLLCQTIIGPTVAQRYQAQARQRPYYGG
jgi:hypothetical protein